MESLVSFFNSKAQLNDDQKEAVVQLDSFFHSHVNCFLLKGYAGTGKTFLIKGLVEYIRTILKKETILMAPTGRAARIISEKTHTDASTIHKVIYDLDLLDEIEVLKKGKVSYKFVFNLRSLEDQIDHLYIIDEASMISDTASESDFFTFGSGKLLSDLMEFVALNNRGRNDKIIFIGDPAQLPPVTDNLSGALSADYLIAQFGISGVQEYWLKQVVRQSNENGILRAATYLRDLLNNPDRNSFRLPIEGGDMENIPLNDVIQQYIETVTQRNDLLSSVIINHSNKSAWEYNVKIREILFPGCEGICSGDILIINQNNYNYDPPLLNGMFVKVLEVSPLPEIRTGLKSYNQIGEEVLISQKFRSVTIEVENYGKPEVVSCMILENALFSLARTLDYSQNIALYVDFKIRYPHLRPKTPEFRDTLRKDKYFNALRVKFGYAVTCHKAQGGEWDTVFVNLNVNQGKLSDFFLRWTYTAITRATSRVYLFNVSEISIFSGINFSPIEITTPTVAGETASVMLEITLSLVSEIEKYGLNQPEKAFLKDKYLEIVARLMGTDIIIEDIIHHQYHEYYRFKSLEKHTAFLIYYNKKGYFTSVQHDVKSGNPGLRDKLKEILEKPFNYSISEMPATEELTAPVPATVFTFDERMPHLELLYQALDDFTEIRDIEIDSIDHEQFHERYYFSRNTEKACLDFWYDGKGCYSYVKPLPRYCNSNKLLEDLQSIIEMLKEV